MIRRVVFVVLVLFAGRVWGAIECSETPGAERILRHGVVILLGELHGTRQGPETVSALVCLAVNRDFPVTVALEIPVQEQLRLDEFMASRGDPGDMDALLAGEFWQRDYQDGRSSVAMLNLLNELRLYRDESPTIRVIAMDPGPGENRDREMAHAVHAEMNANRERIVIGFVGNIHNRLTKGISWDQEYEPLGYQLKKLSPDREILSLELTHSGGTAWVCTGTDPGDCGIKKLKGIEEDFRGVFLADSDEPHITGRLYVGSISASPPARTNSVP